MLTVSDVSLRFSDRKLFDDVNIAFKPGNTYGLIVLMVLVNLLF